MLVVTRHGEEGGNGNGFERQRHFLIIDRQNLFLAALSRLLSTPPLNSRVTLATRTDLALEALATGSIDIVFCDVRSQPLTGPAFVEEMEAREIDVPVILLSDPDDERLLVGAFQCGAVGFFSKSTSYEELLEGIHAILAGHYVVSGNLMGRALNGMGRREGSPTDNRAKRLSPSEVDILTMIGQAQSISAIAATRRISQKTVRNHLASIYKKLDLNGRTEAILCAARMGLTNAHVPPVIQRSLK